MPTPPPPATFSASSASDRTASRPQSSAASPHASLPSFLLVAGVRAAPRVRELTQITLAPASAIEIAIAWPRPLLAPVTMAVSPSSEKGFALDIVRDVESYLLDARHQQMDDEQRGHVCKTAHDEHRPIVVPVRLKYGPRRTLEENSSHSARESADPNDRAQCPARKHVAGQREDVRRPPLVRGCRQSDDRDTQPEPVCRGREHRGHNRQGRYQHCRLTSSIHRPATLDQRARQPAPENRSDVGQHINHNQRRRDAGALASVPRVETLR